MRSDLNPSTETKTPEGTLAGAGSELHCSSQTGVMFLHEEGSSSRSVEILRTTPAQTFLLFVKDGAREGYVEIVEGKAIFGGDMAPDEVATLMVDVIADALKVERARVVDRHRSEDDLSHPIGSDDPVHRYASDEEEFEGSD